MTATAQKFDVNERRAYLGASEIAAVMGLDRWRTPLDVYNSKLGLVPDFEGNQHTLRGQRLESVAADLYTEMTGQKLRRKTSAFSHPQYPFIVGHIDRLVEGKRQIAEIKAPSVAAFRKFQREGLPESMAIQMQVYLGLSGYESGVWLIFCADQMDLVMIEVPFEAAIYNAAIEAAAKFWNENIVPQIPPTEADGEAFEAKNGGNVTFRDDDKFKQSVAAYREAKQLETDAKELIDLTKRDIADAVEGEFGIYEGGGSRVYYQKREGRKSFDKTKLAKEHPEINLSDFEKTGSPFVEFKVYSVGNNKGDNNTL